MMLYAPQTKISRARIGKKVKQKFMVTTEFEIDEYTGGEGCYFAKDLKRELKHYGRFEVVEVVEVGRRK
jgi:hypothetical protein